MSEPKKLIAGKYRKKDRIGEGSYGVVYKAKTTDKQSFAIKKIPYDREDGLGPAYLRELVSLSEMKHPNIVKVIEFAVSSKSGKCWLVMELMNTDLHSYLECAEIHMELYKSYSYQLLDGVAYMHSQGMVHADLKPQNLLIDSVGNLKIADFGLTRVQSSLHNIRDTDVATLWYRPPEMLLGAHHYSTPLDMWAVGCIVLEMFVGNAIFRGNSEFGQLVEIFQKLGTPNDDIWPGFTSLPFFRDNFPKFTPQKIRDIAPALDNDGCEFVYKFLTYDPSLRISARQALSESWVANCDFVTKYLPVRQSNSP